ncbi:MAG TPA: hypothetical protein VGS80_20025 [Ktedonobacterales bacterium]|nr:hypothetical protein [Ktedonobacterales bacterium]
MRSRRESFRYWEYVAGDTVLPQNGATLNTACYRLMQPDGTSKLVPVALCQHLVTSDLAASLKTTADYTVTSVLLLSVTTKSSCPKTRKIVPESIAERQ